MMEAARSLKSLGGVMVEQFMTNVETYTQERRKTSIHCPTSVGRFGFLTNAEYQTRILPDPSQKPL